MAAACPGGLRHCAGFLAVLAAAALLVSVASALEPNQAYALPPLSDMTEDTSSLAVHTVAKGGVVRWSFYTTDGQGQLSLNQNYYAIQAWDPKLPDKTDDKDKANGLVFDRLGKDCGKALRINVRRPLDRALLRDTPSEGLRFDGATGTYWADVAVPKPGCYRVALWFIGFRMCKALLLVTDA